MRKIAKIVAGFVLTAGLGGCWGGGPYDNGASYYLERTDAITMSAGDAKEVNAATHVIDPWPPGVGNRRIPANGERMVGAVERYQTNRSGAGSQGGGTLVTTPGTAGSTGGSPSTSGASGSGSTSGATLTPVPSITPGPY